MNQANEKRVYKFICVLLYIAELPEREKEKKTNWQNFLITNQRVTRGAAAFLVFFFFSFLFTSCLAFTFVFNFTSPDDIVSCGFSSWTLTNSTIFFKLQHNYCVFIFLLLNFNIKCCQLLRSVRWLVENFLHSSEQSFPASCNH